MSEQTTTQQSGTDFNATRYLSKRERESIEQQLGAHAHMASASPDGYTPALSGMGGAVTNPLFTVRKPQMSEHARHLKKVLDEGSPRSLNEKERGEVEKQLNDVQARLEKSGLIETFEEIACKNMQTPVWMKATEKARRRGEIEKDIQKWKNLRRLRFPDDPESDNLDHLRKSR